MSLPCVKLKALTMVYSPSTLKTGELDLRRQRLLVVADRHGDVRRVLEGALELPFDLGVVAGFRGHREGAERAQHLVLDAVHVEHHRQALEIVGDRIEAETRRLQPDHPLLADRRGCR